MASAKPKKLDDAKIQAFAEDRIADCISYDASDRKRRRELALAYTAGEMPDVEPEEGYSSVVSHDIADAKAWLLPSLMRVFCSSDDIVRYEPALPGDEEFANQATDYINYVFLRECDGERIIRLLLDEGLNHGNGIAKHWWDDTPEYRIYTYTDLSDDQFVEIVNDPDVEVLGHSEKPDPSAGGLASPLGGVPRIGPPQGPGSTSGVAGGPEGAAGVPLPDAGVAAGVVPGAGGGLPQPAGDVPGGVQSAPGPAMGPGAAGGMAVAAAADALGSLGLGPALLAPPPPVLHDLKIRRVIRRGRLRIEAVPDEDFGIESAATALNERECRFVYHRETPTRSELIERGFDKDMVWELASVSEGLTDNDRRRPGWYRNGGAPVGEDDYEDKAAERVEVYECYALLDVDGDGIAEWHQIIMGGPQGSQKLLSETEWGGMLPFSEVVPDPVPHVWRGRSLYDRLRDIQRVNTVLDRKRLDNLYQVIEPMIAADLTAVENPDAIFDRRLGGVIRIKPGKDARSALMDLAQPFVAQQATPMVEEMRRVAERRVGVGEQSAGLDADALSNQTATAVAASQSTSGNRIEDYARCCQIGLRRLFGCLLRLTIEHQDRERTIRLRGKWVDVDPGLWNPEMDVTVNVGLGAGNRARDLTMLQGIAQKQEAIVAQLVPRLGLANPIMGLPTLLATYRKMAEASGIRNADQFFPEVDDQILQAVNQQMSAQQQQPDPKLIAAQQKAQIDAALNQQKLAAQQQMNVQALQHKQALAEADLQADMRIREADMANRMQLDQQKSERQILEAQMKAEMAERVARVQAEAKIALESAKAEADMRLRERELALEFRLKEAQMMLDVNRQNATNLEMPE